MKIQISAHNLEISSRFHDYVADRAPKIEHYFHQEADLVIKVTRHDHSRTAGPEDEVELTTHSGGQVLRAHAHAPDKFSAFDAAFGRLLEQLRRAADKRKVHRGRHAQPGTAELSATEFKGLDVHPADVDLLIELEKLAS